MVRATIELSKYPCIRVYTHNVINITPTNGKDIPICCTMIQWTAYEIFHTNPTKREEERNKFVQKIIADTNKCQIKLNRKIETLTFENICKRIYILPIKDHGFTLWSFVDYMKHNNDTLPHPFNTSPLEKEGRICAYTSISFPTSSTDKSSERSLSDIADQPLKPNKLSDLNYGSRLSLDKTGKKTKSPSQFTRPVKSIEKKKSNITFKAKVAK